LDETILNLIENRLYLNLTQLNSIASNMLSSSQP